MYDRLVLFISICVTALATTDPIGMPTWVQAIAGILATGFAGIGVLPSRVTANPRVVDRTVPPNAR
jgi:hypothetical protein